PTVTRIPVGGEVTFTSADDMAHTVTGLGFSWGTSGDLKRGDSASFAFPDEGIFPYACMYHPGMVGAVVVGDGIGTSAAAAPVVANPSPPAPARDVDAAPAADTADIAGWWPVLAVAIAAGGLLAGFVAGRRVRALRGRERTAAA
ncbi:MAG TPA: hypothetical protein VEO00_10430, partial [Actinomycetota bacterium]|nr:hypothetical protein [Actinomycetota bacterium]